MIKRIDNQIIASNIRRLRKELNLTQVEFADTLGYSERQIRRIENAGTNNLAVINQVAEACKVDVRNIILPNASDISRPSPSC